MTDTDTSAPPRIVLTKPKRGGGSNPTTAYSGLLNTVREAGLLERRVGFYVLMFAGITAALVGLGVGFVALGDSWFQLLIAAGLGIIFTQFAFLAHEASHRQVFESGKANDIAGRTLANLFVGISYSWWMTKHSRHHANPNVMGKDPDIERDVISFTTEDAARAKGLYGWFTRHQGYAFFPILMFEGLNLHVHGFRTVFGRGKVDKRWLEISMLSTRIIAYLAVVFFFLPLGMAFAFVGVQLAVFGVYMGASFAPNHKGMPVLPKDSKVDFLRRQVLTSRNIKSTWLTDIYMGGLNYQIEHHLFPNMPRPALKKAQVIAKEYCATHNIPYTETTLLASYGIVIAYLNRVGLSAGGDPFDCPASAAFGR
ncbi:acyl-CoA desaturase [Clavibacter michiganensis subsp. michiganensis]|uniref:fatty acid desaturase family protein n=1 Tax=Clavibacter michiganensis TaxID=28447 RepID=UPI000B731C7B|nr:acyl-CoA desaturase [Clavibacter michiganensis]MWJ17978.1 acyl-CoA desaturase [Clavibacter michiganensis subsp. michiganensis]OUD99532.1 Stearoyl-CoA 9-desaturase [Clavibacter michiganensis subsp. michiganensis]OUE06303.1 Stearoyl-CoA 9-desaturase [Clavibacter michiganensis subsp. michiganensis]